MNNETHRYAWRSLKGETNKIKTLEDNILHSCNWYYCSDQNMENEKVLVFSVEKSFDINQTSMITEDRFLQTKTASGKECSGKIGKWAHLALPGTYHEDGTEKLIDRYYGKFIFQSRNY